MAVNVSHRTLPRDEIGVVIAALSDWEPVGSAAWQLHVGDVGWSLRLDDDAWTSMIHVWCVGSLVVAVGLLESPVLRLAIAPSALDDPAIAEAVTATASQLLPNGDAFVDGPRGIWRAQLATLAGKATPTRGCTCGGTCTNR